MNEGAGFDREGYVNALERLPLPSVEQVEQLTSPPRQ